MDGSFNGGIPNGVSDIKLEEQLPVAPQREKLSYHQVGLRYLGGTVVLYP